MIAESHLETWQNRIKEKPLNYCHFLYIIINSRNLFKYNVNVNCFLCGKIGWRTSKIVQTHLNISPPTWDPLTSPHQSLSLSLVPVRTLFIAIIVIIYFISLHLILSFWQFFGLVFSHFKEFLSKCNFQSLTPRPSLATLCPFTFCSDFSLARKI